MPTRAHASGRTVPPDRHADRVVSAYAYRGGRSMSYVNPTKRDSVVRAFLGR